MRALVPLGEKSSESVPVRVYAMPMRSVWIIDVFGKSEFVEIYCKCMTNDIL